MTVRLDHRHSNKGLWQLVASGSAWAVSGKIASLALALGVHALLARALSPSDFGNYLLAMSIAGFGVTVGSLGLKQTVVNVIARADTHHSRTQLVSNLLRISSIAVPGALLTCFLFAGLSQVSALELITSSNLRKSIIIVGVFASFTLLQMLFAEVFRALKDMRLAVLFATPFSGGGVLSAGLLLIGIGVVLTFTTVSLATVLWYAAISSALTVIAASIFLFRRLKSMPIRSAPPGNTVGYSDIFRMAIPVLITNITLFALSQSSLWIVAGFLSEADAASYAAANRLVLLVATPLLIANAVLPPYITQLYSKGSTHLLESLLRLVATMTGYPALIALFGLVALGKTFLAVVFGDFYVTGYSVLVLLSLGQAVNVWAGSSGITLIFTGNYTAMMLITIGAGAISVLASIYFVTDFGVAGVAAASAFGLLLQNLLMLCVTRLRLGIWTHMALFPLRHAKLLRAAQ